MSNCERLTPYNSLPQLITLSNQRELRLSSYSVTSGTTVELSCVNNFNLIGRSTVTCQDGKWDFDTKPYCADAGSVSTSDGSLSDETKILIGVLVGVLGVVILVILIILCIIESRIRRRKEEKKALESTQDTLDDTTLGNSNPGYWSEEVTYKPPSFSRAHMPNIFAIPMHKREFPFRKPLSEPDFQTGSFSGHGRKSRSLHSADSDISAYRFYRPAQRNQNFDSDDDIVFTTPSRFQRNQPPREPPKDYASKPESKRKDNKRSVASEPIPKKQNKYVGNWIPRDSMKACKGFNERALLHGRDPFLWKKVDNNWGVHLEKRDVKSDFFG